MSRREIEDLIDKARRSVAAAQRLLSAGDADFAISRAYYAMFYAASAVLLNRGIRRSKHAGIISVFNQQFVRTGELESELFDWFREAFEQRGESDYTIARFTPEEGSLRVELARKFVERLAVTLGL